MMSRTRVVAGCGMYIAIALLIAGCAAPNDLAPGTGSTDVSPTSPAAASPPSAGGKTVPATIPHDAEQPSASPAVGAEAITIATEVATAFCRPSLDRQTWINGLYPFLSQTAAVAYQTVNPARVPCSAVTGDAWVRDSDGSFTTRVIVPTNGGEYSVYVHRPAVTDPWLVEQVVLLAGN